MLGLKSDPTGLELIPVNDRNKTNILYLLAREVFGQEPAPNLSPTQSPSKSRSLAAIY